MIIKDLKRLEFQMLGGRHRNVGKYPKAIKSYKQIMAELAKAHKEYDYVFKGLPYPKGKKSKRANVKGGKKTLSDKARAAALKGHNVRTRANAKDQKAKEA